MIQHGKPPYIECSSQGDCRFSAFYARPKSLKGRSIEEAYQAMKVFPDGSTGLSWRRAKGRTAINIEDCASAYRQWWREWVDEQNLWPDLLWASGLSDQFGQKGHQCQATVLWDLRNDPHFYPDERSERNSV